LILEAKKISLEPTRAGGQFERFEIFVAQHLEKFRDSAPTLARFREALNDRLTSFLKKFQAKILVCAFIQPLQ
jgi:hypothetical protein